jgi:hypothetical protein
MMEENVKGGHETYLKLFCGDKRWNVIGMSATPDKLIGGLEEVSNTPFEIHQLDNKSPKEHVKYFRVVGPSGKMVGYLGKNRGEELIRKIKEMLPGNRLINSFFDLGILTKSPHVDSCIFSEANENIDHKKLLKVIGHQIMIKAKGDGLGMLN